MHFDVVEGNIARQTAHGLVSTTSPDFRMKCGVAGELRTQANVCVLHTADSAGLRDYRPVVVQDALSFIEENHREYAVEHADWLFGETIDRADIEFS